LELCSFVKFLFDCVVYSLSEKKTYLFSFLAIIVIYLMVGSTTLASSIMWINIPNIDYKYYLIWAILGVLIIINFPKNLKIDIITLLLILRSVLLCSMTVVNVDKYPDSWKINLIAHIFLPFVYYIAKHAVMTYEEVKSFLLKVSCLFTFILSVQIILLFIQSVLIKQLGWNYVKSTIEVPLGRSNYLAAFLIIFLIYIDNIMPSSLKKYFIISMGVVGIFCSMSDGAYIVMGAYFLPSFFMKIKKSVFIGKINYRAFVALALVTIVIGYIFMRYWSVVSEAFQHFLRDTFYVDDMRGFLNGRDSVYTNSVNIIKNNWLFGIGLGTLIGHTTRSHNLILQLLVSGGIVNLIIFMYIYIKTFVLNFMERKESEFARAVMLVMLFSFINSMFEPTYQSIMYDLIMFTFMGFSLNYNIKRVGGSKCLRAV